MTGKIVQISCMNDNEEAHAAIWALTDEGEIYFLVLSEGIWYKQALPSGEVPVQEME